MCSLAALVLKGRVDAGGRDRMAHEAWSICESLHGFRNAEAAISTLLPVQLAIK